MSNPTDLRGRRFGRLVVVGPVTVQVRRNRNSTIQERRTHWNCLCDCGKSKVVRGGDLTRGDTQSCGCMRAMTYSYPWNLNCGYSSHPLYVTWKSIKKRCFDPKCKDYKYYGALGVTICDQWMNFENFLADIGDRPEGKTIDRYPDNNGNYEPGNVRWATRKEQVGNRRNTIHR